MMTDTSKPELVSLYSTPWHQTMDGVKSANGVWILKHSHDFERQVIELANSYDETREQLSAANAEIERLRGHLTARSKSLIKLRNALISIRDELEDEGDRVYFGSTNDADQFRDVVEDLDGWNWEDTYHEALGTDPYEAARKANAELAAKDAVIAGLGSTAAQDVLAERQRQKDVEGWTPERDDTHTGGQMAGAAACYALTGVAHWACGAAIDTFWPWDKSWWKPTNPRRDLVKAAALLLAEIERLDRLSLAKQGGNDAG